MLSFLFFGLDILTARSRFPFSSVHPSIVHPLPGSLGAGAYLEPSYLCGLGSGLGTSWRTLVQSAGFGSVPLYHTRYDAVLPGKKPPKMGD